MATNTPTAAQRKAAATLGISVEDVIALQARQAQKAASEAAHTVVENVLDELVDATGGFRPSSRKDSTWVGASLGPLTFVHRGRNISVKVVITDKGEVTES